MLLTLKKPIKIALLLAALPVAAAAQATPAAGQENAQKSSKLIDASWLASAPTKPNEPGRLCEERRSFKSATGCLVAVTCSVDPKPAGFTGMVAEMLLSIIQSSLSERDNAISVELFWRQTEEGWEVDNVNVTPKVEKGLLPEAAIQEFCRSVKELGEAGVPLRKKALRLKEDVTVFKAIAEELKKLRVQRTPKEGPVSAEKLLDNTMLAAASADVSNRNSSACNICVRAALLLLKQDAALFPTSGSYFHDPYDGHKAAQLFGHIKPDGRAKPMKEDFDNISNHTELNARFVEQKKLAAETWSEYFQKLQHEADKGFIVVGVMLNRDGTQGHVMMITPGGMVNIKKNEKKQEQPEYQYGKSFTDKGISEVLRVLECGGAGVRENEAPLCRNVDYRGATERLKWFKYKK
jgi:hypothetical protein